MPGKLRILVDTTFLLPALGISVEDEAEEVIPLFRKAEIYYLEVAVLEAMWMVVKVVPSNKLNRVEEGREAIRNTYHLLEPPPVSYIMSIKIHNEGHKDYIDALHYATAKTSNIPLLTIDRELMEFLEKHGYETKGIVITPVS